MSLLPQTTLHSDSEQHCILVYHELWLAKLLALAHFTL
jgi:hypothetical protein